MRRGRQTLRWHCEQTVQADHTAHRAANTSQIQHTEASKTEPDGGYTFGIDAGSLLHRVYRSEDSALKETSVLGDLQHESSILVGRCPYAAITIQVDGDADIAEAGEPGGASYREIVASRPGRSDKNSRLKTLTLLGKHEFPNAGCSMMVVTKGLSLHSGTQRCTKGYPEAPEG